MKIALLPQAFLNRGRGAYTAVPVTDDQVDKFTDEEGFQVLHSSDSEEEEEEGNNVHSRNTTLHTPSTRQLLQLLIAAVVITMLLGCTFLMLHPNSVNNKLAPESPTQVSPSSNGKSNVTSTSHSSLTKQAKQTEILPSPTIQQPSLSQPTLAPTEYPTARIVREPSPSTTTSTDRYPSTMPTLERQKFQVNVYEHNLTYLQEPKSTPSGWWPDANWIRQCVSKNRTLTPFDTLDGWTDYRLGDCVKLCSGCPTGTEMPKLSHGATIAGKYYDLACDPRGPQYHMRRGNVTLLMDIIDKMKTRNGFTVPHPDAIVIHLRLGDKIEDSASDVYTMLQKSADPGHKTFQNLHAVKSLYEFLTNVVTSKASRVVIRGGSQKPNMFVKSKTYAYCLEEALTMAGYDVDLSLEQGNADIDFYFMVHAQKLITTVGGFSRYIGHLVFERGGIVYGRVF